MKRYEIEELKDFTAEDVKELVMDGIDSHVLSHIPASDIDDVHFENSYLESRVVFDVEENRRITVRILVEEEIF